MKSKKLEIYALAVCFASVVCLVISISIAGYSIVRIIDPGLTMYSCDFDRYQTNDRYWESKQSFSKERTKVIRPPEAVLTKQRLEALRIATEGEKRGGARSLIQSLMFVVASAVTLGVHWRIAKKARKR